MYKKKVFIYIFYTETIIKITKEIVWLLNLSTMVPVPFLTPKCCQCLLFQQPQMLLEILDNLFGLPVNKHNHYTTVLLC